MKYRKKPVVIKAIQFNGHNHDEILSFMGSLKAENDRVFIQTLEGEMTANLYDWIIKGVKGEFYPCKPDIFKATYEAVE